MAEILIKLADYIHSDPVKDRRGVNKRGDIVARRPDGWSAGPHWAQSQMCYAKAGKFVLVKCPEIAIAEVETWADSWKDDFAYTIVSQNAAQGLYVVRVFEQNAGAAGQNNLTRAKVETCLTKWGCTGLTFTTNSCEFTFSLWNAVRSESFWERDVSSVVFTLVSYSSTTGIGRISANCNAIIEQFVITHANDPQAEEKIKGEIGRKIPERGGTLIGWTGRILTFEIERSDILTRFRDDVKRKAEQTYMCRRYQVSAADVDAIVAAGGVITLTKAQVLAKLKDKMA